MALRQQTGNYLLVVSLTHPVYAGSLRSSGGKENAVSLGVFKTNDETGHGSTEIPPCRVKRSQKERGPPAKNKKQVGAKQKI